MTITQYKFVFDLDDTLYQEREYAVSALRFFGKQCEELGHANDISDHLVMLFLQGESDAIGRVCAENCIPDAVKESLMVGMRAHLPTITLRQDARQLIEALRTNGYNFSIITDGRSVTQRAKIASLGLQDAEFVMISEEVGAAKPDPTAFLAIAQSDRAAQYIYVGDNPRKDFIAPNKLGWLTIMLRDNGDNTHSQTEDYPQASVAKIQVKSLRELLKFVQPVP